MMAKYGVLELNDHYKNAGDTICDATQERQDAMYKLVEEKPDLMLVIGGFNSSNTQHLQEISEDAGIVSYWVDTPDRVDTSNVIVWRTAHGELITTKAMLAAAAGKNNSHANAGAASRGLAKQGIVPPGAKGRALRKEEATNYHKHS